MSEYELLRIREKLPLPSEELCNKICIPVMHSNPNESGKDTPYFFSCPPEFDQIIFVKEYVDNICIGWKISDD